MERRFAALAGALLLLLVQASAASAGEPDPGHQDLYSHSIGDARRVLDFHFGSLTYPQWFLDTAENELETSWDAISANNSGVPRYGNGGDNSGGGSIIYTTSGTSPCTGDPSWIGCNPAGGKVDFSIYIRSFPSSSAPTWLWWDRDSTCNDVRPGDGYATSVCFSVRRVLAHESTHNTLTRLHNTLADDESIMQATTPTPNKSPDNWNRRNFLPCDEAGAQLEYGLADPSREYADCFRIFPGDGAKGLSTKLTLTSATSDSGCTTQTVSAHGRLALGTSSDYEDMRDTPLDGRVVRIDRKPHSSTSWTNGVYTTTASDAKGDNWRQSISSATSGTFDYRAGWYTSSGEPALNSSNQVTWTISWRGSPCPTAVGN
jgi:hypothetical protein